MRHERGERYVVCRLLVCRESQLLERCRHVKDGHQGSGSQRVGKAVRLMREARGDFAALAKNVVVQPGARVARSGWVSWHAGLRRHVRSKELRGRGPQPPLQKLARCSRNLARRLLGVLELQEHVCRREQAVAAPVRVERIRPGRRNVRDVRKEEVRQRLRRPPGHVTQTHVRALLCMHGLRPRRIQLRQLRHARRILQKRAAGGNVANAYGQLGAHAQAMRSELGSQLAPRTGRVRDAHDDVRGTLPREGARLLRHGLRLRKRARGKHERHGARGRQGIPATGEHAFEKCREFRRAAFLARGRSHVIEASTSGNARLSHTCDIDAILCARRGHELCRAALSGSRL